MVREDKKRAHMDVIAKMVRSWEASKEGTKLLHLFRLMDRDKVGNAQWPGPRRLLNVCCSQDSTVDRNEFRLVVGQMPGYGRFHCSEEEVDILEEYFFPEGKDRLNYRHFVKSLEEAGNAQLL